MATGFSFGYKNLNNDQANNPGPGYYEIKDAFSKIPSQKRVSIRPNRFQRPIQNPDYFTKQTQPEEEMESSPGTQISSKKRVGITFPKSQQARLSIILPVISRGPQHYDLPTIIGTKKNSIKFDKYSKRIFDYSSPVPGVGSYFKEESSNGSWKLISQKKVVLTPTKPFRELSYLNHQIHANLGPGTYEVTTDPKKGFTFMRSIRQKTDENYTPGVGEYLLDIKEKPGPKFSIPKEDSKHQSYYAQKNCSYIYQSKVKLFSNQTPSPQHQIQSMKSFKRAIDTLSEKSITFTKAKRTNDQTEQLPGPGDYEIHNDFCKKSFSKRIVQPLLNQIASSHQNSAYFQVDAIPGLRDHRKSEKPTKTKINSTQNSQNKPQDTQSLQHISSMGIDALSQHSISFSKKKKKQNIWGIRRSQFATDQYKMSFEQDCQTDKVQSSAQSESPPQLGSKQSDSQVDDKDSNKKNLMVFKKAQLLLWQFKKRQIQQSEKKGTFQKSERKLEFLDTFGISCKQERAPGPGFYQNVRLERKKTAVFPQSQKPPLFKINPTPDPGQYVIRSYFDQTIKSPVQKKRPHVEIQQFNLQKLAQMAEQLLEIKEQ